jgi:hypothetical protein
MKEDIVMGKHHKYNSKGEKKHYSSKKHHHQCYAHTHCNHKDGRCIHHHQDNKDLRIHHGDCRNGYCSPTKYPVSQEDYFNGPHSERRYQNECHSGKCNHSINSNFDHFLNDPTW